MTVRFLGGPWHGKTCRTLQDTEIPPSALDELGRQVFRHYGGYQPSPPKEDEFNMQEVARYEQAADLSNEDETVFVYKQIRRQARNR